MGHHFVILRMLLVEAVWGGWFYWPAVANYHDLCRRLDFSVWIKDYALQGHVDNNLSLPVGPSLGIGCRHRCVMDPVCVSVNVGPTFKDRYICELSDSDHMQDYKDMEPREGFMYMGTENPCFSEPCLRNGTCLSGFTDKKYLCECPAGYTGEQCEKDIDECVLGTHNCSVHAVCNNTNGSFSCDCNDGFTGNGYECTDVDECVSGVHACHGFASCTNTVGSYTCSCNQPYIGDGFTCTMTPECENYQSLTSADRKITNGNQFHCDSALGPDWFRFQGAAGTKMPTTCQPINKCGTSGPGWLNGAHPIVADGQVTRQVCFSWSICCYWTTNIQVRNCGSFYVYYLSGTGGNGCDLRYCGTD